MEENIDELIVFVIRQTGWLLEYVRDMEMAQLVTLARELAYQKAIEDYRVAYNFALALASWASANTKGKKYRPEDFIGPQPSRDTFFKEVDKNG